PGLGWHAALRGRGVDQCHRPIAVGLCAPARALPLTRTCAAAEAHPALPPIALETQEPRPVPRVDHLQIQSVAIAIATGPLQFLDLLCREGHCATSAATPGLSAGRQRLVSATDG